MVSEPDSGSVFPIGNTIVTVTASSEGTEIDSGTFTVTVQDTTAPSIVAPFEISTVSLSPEGTEVEFDVSATDETGNVTVVCEPPSGSVFPIGTTTVVVTATDEYANVNSTELYVTVERFKASKYTGLITPTEASSTPQAHVGIATISVTNKGAFTGKLTLGGSSKKISVSGKLNDDGSMVFGKAGNSTLLIERAGKIPLELQLQLDIRNTTQVAQLTGTLANDGTTMAELTAHRALYTAKLFPELPLLNVPVELLDPQTDKGKYTVLITADAEQEDEDAVFPLPDGWALLTVAKTGMVKAVGKLADGTPFTCSQPMASIGSDNEWPFYVSLYKGSGSISGTVAFPGDDFFDDWEEEEPEEEEDVDQGDAYGANILWFKPPSLTDKVYRTGWASGIEAKFIASKYIVPVDGTVLIPILEDDFFDDLEDENSGPIDMEGEISFTNGWMPGEVTSGVDVAPNGKAVCFNWLGLSKQPKVHFNVKNGMMTGSFIHPVSLKNTKVSGVVFQYHGYASGFFIGAPEPGSTAAPESGEVFFTERND